MYSVHTHILTDPMICGQNYNGSISVHELCYGVHLAEEGALDTEEWWGETGGPVVGEDGHQSAVHQLEQQHVGERKLVL